MGPVLIPDRPTLICPGAKCQHRSTSLARQTVRLIVQLVEEIRHVEADVEAARQPLREPEVDERVAVGLQLHRNGTARVVELRAGLIHRAADSGRRQSASTPIRGCRDGAAASAAGASRRRHTRLNGDSCRRRADPVAECASSASSASAPRNRYRSWFSNGNPDGRSMKSRACVGNTERPTLDVVPSR